MTRTLRPLLVLVLVLTAGLAPGCRDEPAERGEATDPSEELEMAPEARDRGVDAMAAEHAGDRPEPSAAALAEPATAVDGTEVVYATVDGRPVTGYLARPSGVAGPLPGLVVIHEWWGLNDNIRAATRRLAGEGYAALAVDLYGGAVADDPERARELVTSVDEEEALENLRQAALWFDDEDGGGEAFSFTGRLGTIGWCFGGAWSLRSALAMPDLVDATVVYYGRVPTDAGELEALDAPLLGLFGADDGSIPVATVREFEATLERLGKDADVHLYEGAGHAFANPSGRNYVEDAAADAWRRTTAFLARHLRVD